VRELAAWQRMDWTHALRGAAPHVGSIHDPAKLLGDAGLHGIAGIAHLAALVRHSRTNADEVYRVNVDGALAMVRLAAARRCRLIFASTSGTVGCFRTPGQSADEDAPYCEDEVRHWPYYHSKVVAERKARALAQELGVELVIIRPPVLLGPGDHRFRSTGNLIRFLRGTLPFLIRGGMHFADIRDVARALAVLATQFEMRPVYHFVGTICGIEEFFAMAGEAAGLAPPRHVLPYPLAWTLATLLKPLHALPDPVVIENAAHYWATSSRYAEADLGYRSRDGMETLRDTIAWLRANHPLLAATAST
jgi:dihydroflavonol-4-reductase